MYLHARAYRVLDLVEVDLRTEPDVAEGERGVSSTSRVFVGAVPAELEGQPELIVLLDALRAAARSSIRDLEAAGRYQGPQTDR